MRDIWTSYRVTLGWYSKGRREAEIVVKARTAMSAIDKARKMTAPERGRGVTIDEVKAVLV